MFLLSMLLSSAFAQTSVFVAPFTSMDPKADRLADEIPNMILDGLDQNKKVKSFDITQMQPVHDVPASEYMKTCVRTEFVGCAFVIGKASEVEYAIVGAVVPLTSGVEVDLRVVEISSAREVFKSKLQLAEGGEDAFGITVNRTITGIIDGTIGQQVDLREEEQEDGYNAEEASAVDEYTKNEGGAETVKERVDVEIEDKKITPEDLAVMMEMEGSKEWDRLGMKPKEYMNYFNSGMSLARWKDLTNGRKEQVLLRVDLGVLHGLVNGQYYGSIAKSNIDLSVIDSYAWQTLDNGTGVDLSLGAAYGVLPFLDVGVIGGRTTGSFTLDVHSFVTGQFSARPPSVSYLTSALYGGLQVFYTPLVMPRIRPVVGAQFVHWQMASMNFEFGQELYPNLPSASYNTLDVILGGEMKVNDVFDVYVHIPTGVAFGASNAPVVQQQNGGILSVDLPDGDMAKVKPPEKFAPLNIGVNVGLQFRIPVAKKRPSSFDMYE